MKAIRWILVGTATLAAAASAHPAQAAALSGTIKATRGGSACDQFVTCRVFRENCAAPPAEINDLDSSVRLAPASVKGVAVPLRWTVGNGLKSAVVVQGFDANCNQVFFAQRTSNTTIVIPATTKWVTVVSVAYHAGLTWSIG